MFTLGAARASDCFLDTDELRIDGGKYDGFRIGWSAIVASHSRVDYEGVLWLNLGEISVPIAVAVDDDERHSLGVMVQAIRSRETERSGAIVPRPPVVDAHLQIAVIVCPSCGAPSGIDDVPQVRCHDCGVAVPVSDEMRSRIRAARDLRRDRGTIDALVEKLLNQPTASRVNGMLVALAALMIWWLPLPAMVQPLVVDGCDLRAWSGARRSRERRHRRPSRGAPRDARLRGTRFQRGRGSRPLSALRRPAPPGR